MAVAKSIVDITKNVLLRFRKHVKGLQEYSIDKLIEFLDKVEYWHIIIPQEVVAGRGFIDMDLFNRIIFEFKGKKSEFKDGYAKILNSYLPNYPRALYAIITNYNTWEIYRVTEAQKLELIYQGDRSRAIHVIESIIEDILSAEGYRIPPHPNAISILFSDLISFEDGLKKVFDKISDDPRIRPLYEAFKTIITMLYSETNEEFIAHLFMKHTILQTIVLASLSKVLNKTMVPIEMCSGIKLDVEVALPYLNWWFIAYTRLRDRLSKKDVEFIEKLVREIATRISMIDWDIVYLEDVFREFYELLIDRETRRKIGEYYTPLWVVELIINRIKHLSGGLRDKIVLDPFCGSGSFLVMAFYEKIKEGEDPDEAFTEVIGFDINPLAVSIARAELILAYRKVCRGRRTLPRPLVFHTDTLYSMFKQGIPSFYAKNSRKHDLLSYLKAKKALGLEELEIIESRILRLVIPYLAKEVSEIREKPKENLIELLRIEGALGGILRSALVRCKNVKDNIRKCLKKHIECNLKQFLSSEEFGKTSIGRIFKKQVFEKIDEFCNALTELLEKYGNGVWATSIVSMLAPLVVKHIKADIIMTNPPWLQLTKFKTYYAETLTSYATNLIRKVGVATDKAGRIVMGSDLASMALYGALNMSKNIVAFVMPREASFYAKTSQRSGILLTYSVFKSFENTIDNVEMIDLNFDAFQHGNYPSLVIVKFK